MLRRWMVSGLCVGLLASALLAKPGVVTDRHGQTFKGDVTEDDKYVYIQGAGGQIRLDKRNATITYADTIDTQYKARYAKLAPNDVQGRIDLAQWANANQRADIAVAVLREARKIDPMNKDAARALDAAEQQLDMDQAGVPKAHAPAVVTTAPSGTAPTTQTTAAAPEIPKVRRLLTMDEINIIRQKEMQQDDPKIRVRLENGVVRRYLATGDHDPAEFAKLTPQAQAAEILAHGDAKMSKDVHILTDPAAIAEYRTKVQPLIANGCASTACHGGTKAGDFALYSGDSTSAAYTNFYTLFGYSLAVDGVRYLALDRDTPERSLVLQYGLPRADGKPPHPKVANWRARFKSTSDPAYDTISSWMTKSLSVMQPEYGIQVAVRLPVAASEPAAAGSAPLSAPLPAASGEAPSPAQPITPVLPFHPDHSPKVNPDK